MISLWILDLGEDSFSVFPQEGRIFNSRAEERRAILKYGFLNLRRVVKTESKLSKLQDNLDRLKAYFELEGKSNLLKSKPCSQTFLRIGSATPDPLFGCFLIAQIENQ